MFFSLQEKQIHAGHSLVNHRVPPLEESSMNLGQAFGIRDQI